MTQFKPGDLVEFKTMNSQFSNTVRCSILDGKNIAFNRILEIVAANIGIKIISRGQGKKAK